MSKKSRKYPYSVSSRNKDILKLVYSPTRGTYSVASKGKSALTDDFREYARQTFSEKWSARLISYGLDESRAVAGAVWKFRFRSENDALLFKLMS